MPADDAPRAEDVSSASGRSVGAPIIEVMALDKVYAGGFKALDDINLSVRRGEIFALLGPNGAGKSTLINLICGLVRPTAGRVLVGGHDIVKDFRKTRAMIGLVPQELSTDSFETVFDTVTFSRGLFGRSAKPAYIEVLLMDLALWEKRRDKIRTLSGGMKRRVLIAKALSHEPDVLFLDEPTAGVDVELRQSMWAMVRRLRERGVTIILTTHYLAEAEEMADRVAIINRGRIVLVDEKAALLTRLGQKELIVHLASPLADLPAALAGLPLQLGDSGGALVCRYKADGAPSAIADILRRLSAAGIDFRDVETRESSLEDIFVDLIRAAP